MNLVEINAAAVTDKDSFILGAVNAAFIATLQAGYTDFHYLRPIWKQTTEEDALIGVGITGIAADTIPDEWLADAAYGVRRMNEVTADNIGINRAARTTTIKPSGTSSLVVGSASGIHGYHAPFYLRRMRLGKDEALCKYLQEKVPELLEDCKEKPHTQSILTIPQRSPQGAIVRTEPALELLERVLTYNRLWVKEGHVYGDNRNNVSCTISLKDDEWHDVGEWMWSNRDSYNGISVLPYDGGTYVQAPFEDCTEEEYERLLSFVKDIDLSEIREGENNTNLMGELACQGGACEIL